MQPLTSGSARGRSLTAVHHSGSFSSVWCMHTGMLLHLFISLALPPANDRTVDKMCALRWGSLPLSLSGTSFLQNGSTVWEESFLFFSFFFFRMLPSDVVHTDVADLYPTGKPGLELSRGIIGTFVTVSSHSNSTSWWIARWSEIIYHRLINLIEFSMRPPHVLSAPVGMGNIVCWLVPTAPW